MAYVKTNWVDNTTPIDENNLNKIESGIKNNDINIGEENYDNTKTYEVGDIVRYNEKIYKCITAITTAENFDISKWEQTNIVEIVQSEKSKIYELIEAISTPIVGEGENITLNDTAEKRFENFDIEGNSEQEATPSPDYPSEVKSCGDNVNIFDKDNTTFNNKDISATPTPGNTLQYFNTTKAIQFEVDVAKYVNRSIYFSIDTSTIKHIKFQNLDKDRKFIKGIEKLTDFQKLDITSNTKYLNIIIISENDISNVDNLKLMISLTNVNGTGAYSPYGQGCINEVICNKNLFDKNTTTDGKYIDGNGSIQTQSNIMYSDYIQIKTNINYYITGRSEWASVALYDKNKTFLEIISTTQPNGVLNITNSNCKYIIINALLTDKDTLQLEEGSTATTYIEHQSQSYTIPTQQPMRAIGDIRDKFIKKNNKWYEHHPIVRIESYNGETITSEYISNTGELSTGATVDYISDTPVDIECTEEQSTILFDIEQNAKTYKGVTHIYSNDEVSPNCYVEAVKDLTTLIQ